MSNLKVGLQTDAEQFAAGFKRARAEVKGFTDEVRAAASKLNNTGLSDKGMAGVFKDSFGKVGRFRGNGRSLKDEMATVMGISPEMRAQMGKYQSAGLMSGGGGAGMLGGLMGAAGPLAGPIAGLATVHGLVALFEKATKAAGELKVSEIEVKTAFGGASEQVFALGEKMESTFGVAEEMVRSAAADMGLLTQSMGVSRERSAALSSALVEAGTTAATALGKDPAEMFDALKMGLAGNERGLRRFGIIINEAKVEAKAFQMGLKQAGEELDENAKIEARAAIEMDELTKRSAGIGEMMGGAGVESRKFWESLDEAMKALGKELAPIKAELFALGTDVVRGLIVPAFEGAASSIKLLVDTIKSAKPALEWAQNPLGKGMQSLGIDEGVGDWASKAFYELRGGLKSTLGWDKEAQSDWAKGFTGSFGDAAKSIEKVGDAAKDAGVKSADLQAQLIKMGDEVHKTAKGWIEEGLNLGLSSHLAQVAVKMRELEAKAATATTSEERRVIAAQRKELTNAATVAGMVDEQQKFAKFVEQQVSASTSLIESTKTPLEKLEEEKDKIGRLLDMGLIDATTAARGILKAEKDSGLGEVKRAGAALFGSAEARSSILANQDRASRMADPLQAIANQSRTQVDLQARSTSILNDIHAMMRQAFGASFNAPVVGAIQ